MNPYNYPPDFPKDLLEKAFDLYELGNHTFAWKREHVFEVMNYLCSNDFVILGGDVYMLGDNILQVTVDSWYCDYDSPKNWPQFTEKWPQFIDKGKTASVLYIDAYHLRNGEQFCYSLVFQDKLQCYMRGQQ